jgi:hypothetical protein
MKKKNRVVDAKYFITVIVIIFLITLAFQKSQVSCTQEAKLCPDGSYVGRSGSDCQFSQCPEDNCSGFAADNCPSECVVCPPCEVCSSISCRTEQFCNSIGFNRTWWQQVRPCQCPEGYVREGDVCNPACYYSIPRCLIPSVSCS